MLDRVTAHLSNLLKMAAGVALVGMMLFTCLDALLRYLNAPMTGLRDMVAYLGAGVVAFALPMTQQRRGQVGVEILTMRLKIKTASWFLVVTDAVSCALCAIIAWRCWVYAALLHSQNEMAMDLDFPKHVVVRAVAVSFGVLALVIFNQTLNGYKKAVAK